MTTWFRIVAWHVDETGCKSIRGICEFKPTKTLSGTQRKLGQQLLNFLDPESVDHVVVEKRIEVQPKSLGEILGLA